jgi:hypothetical protein
MWKARRPVSRLLLRGLRVSAKLDRLERLVDEIHDSLSTTDWEKATPASLLARFRLRTQLGSQTAEAGLVLSGAVVAAYSALAQVLGPLTNDVDQLVRDVISTRTTTGGAQLGRMLLDLARTG